MKVKPGYKQTEVGVIPDEWEVVQLGDLNPFVTSGSRGWAAHYSERGSLFVRITNLSRESVRLDLTDSEFVKLPPGASEGARTQLNEHDVLISITADIGIVGYVDAAVPSPAYINQHIALVRFDPSQAVGKFVSYFLASEKPQRLFRASTDVGAKAGMSLITVQKIQTALPPLSEQRAIAEVLSDVDGLLGGLDRLIAKKRDLKQAAMQQLLTGQTRLPGFHGEWETVKAGDIGIFRGGNGFPTRSQGEAANDYPFYKVSDMNNEGNGSFMSVSNNWISEATRKQLGATSFPAGCIIFAKVGAAVFLERKKILTRPSCIDNNLAALALDKSRADVRFIHYSLLNIKFGALVSITALPSLIGSVLAQIVLALPPLPEQTAIAAVLADIDVELAALEQRLAKTRALKQGMMQELLTGRTRLRS